MRIVGGTWAGRSLTSPPDRRVRPTAEPVRARWLTLLEPELAGATVLDLFAGSGALGLEALSRGASTADLVESRATSLHSLRANVAALRVRDRVRIYKRDALAHAAGLPRGAYAVAFADPPYGSRMLDRLIEIWRDRGFAELLTVEHAPDHELPSGGRRMITTADTAVTWYRLDPSGGREPETSEAPRGSDLDR